MGKAVVGAASAEEDETKAYSDFNMAKSASRVLELRKTLGGHYSGCCRGRDTLLPVPFLLVPFLPVPFLPLEGLKVASRPVLLPRAEGRLEATRREGAGVPLVVAVAAAALTGEGVGGDDDDDAMGGAGVVRVRVRVRGIMTLSRM